ncbi:MAG: carboxylate--amine ligase [Betaproteobacteria bacterium]
MDTLAWQAEAGQSFDPSVPVLVLKMHHGSLGIARSLGRLGVAVYGLTAGPRSWAASSRYWRACYDWDVENSPPQRSVEFLLELGRRLGSMPLLIPVSDHTALFVAGHRAALRTAFRLPDLSHELALSLASKKEMYFLAKRCGIPTPETLFPQSRQDLIGLLDRIRFPVLLKGIDGPRLQTHTGRTMIIVRTVSELLEHYDLMEEPANPNLMLQEYIPGGEDSVWMFNGYFDQNSRCLAAFTGKKIRQTPAYTGSTSLGIMLHNPAVSATTMAFMKEIGYRGILDIGYRYDARDGQYKVLDVNPRIGSTFRLFVDRNGMDVVRVLYRDLTRQPIPEVRPLEGRKWIVEDQDLWSSRRYWNDGKLSLGQWLASFRGIREGAWFAWDDLRPFMLLCRSMGAICMRWMRRKFAMRARQSTAF